MADVDKAGEGSSNGNKDDRRASPVRKGSRSPSRSRSASRSRSKSRSSRSRSRSYSSRSRSRSRSPRRSRSRSPKRRTPSPDPKVLYVEKLTKNVNNNHLNEIFGAYGKIKSAEIVWDRKLNQPKGAANIEFVEKADADNALLAMNGAQIDGNVIQISLLKAKREHSPRPYMGNGGRRFSPRRWIQRTRKRRKQLQRRTSKILAW